ncbi:MAG: EamA family transporter [Alphaproteobacteria bacterium]|nr:EamA family transporter [Alphaproteobacteria bacterium]
MRPRDVAAYVFLAFLWGASFLVLLRVVSAFGWAGAVSLRSLLAAAVLAVLARLFGRRLAFSAGWRHFAIVGATTVAGQLVGLSIATPLIGTAMAAILVATIPLFSMLIGRMWRTERIGRRAQVGLVAGFGGIVLLVGFPATPVDANFAFGCAASILSAIAAAFGSNYANVTLRGTSSIEITTGAFAIGGLMTLPLLLFVPLPAVPTAAEFGYLLVLGGTMSAVAYVVYFRLVSAIGATRAISVEFAVTLVAVAIGATFLGERLGPVQIAGAILIVLGCGTVLGVFPPKRRA